MIFIQRTQDVVDGMFDEVYLVTRSNKQDTKNRKWLPELAPSPELFGLYLDYKKAKRWNRDTFETHYVPLFLIEMSSPEFQAALDKIIFESSKGKRICLSCFCKDELCHTEVIHKHLVYRGVDCINLNRMV